MALKKLTLRPGINRENTRYTNENGWYEGDKVRFRQGTPEKIGGWARISTTFFLGVCRSLWAWVSGVSTYIGVGTNLKFYIERGGVYNDVTPLRATVTLTNPFTYATASSFYVDDAAGGFQAGDFVTFSGASATGGITLNGEYQIATITNVGATQYSVSLTQRVTMASNYQTFTGVPSVTDGVAVTLGTVGTGSALPGGFTAGTTYYVVNSTGASYKLAATPGGTAITATSLPGGVITATPQFTGSFTAAGGSVTAAYQVNTGYDIQVQGAGWGGGGWGLGGWGTGDPSTSALRIWSQANFGPDLVFGPVGGPIYFWSAAAGVGVRGGLLASEGGTITATTTTAPSSFTLQYAYPNGTAIQVDAATLPTGLTAGVTYYIQNVEGLTCNLSTDRGGAGLVTVGTLGTGMYISSLEDVPKVQNYLLVADTLRFIFAFGANDYGSSTQNAMLVRWSDQESSTIWYPQSTNQAGSVQLSRGSKLVTALQARQEILVWTDSSLYSFQYVGAPVVWKNELVGENISLAGPNAVAYANGVAFWMGVDKFYLYDGRTQTLPCDLRQFVFTDNTTKINQTQIQQVCCGTNEGFNEIWWFYPSEGSTTINTYVVYNYAEKVWYYGFLGRTAWLDTGLRPTPVAATYNNNLVDHEVGTDDGTTGTVQPIESYISSAEFDIDDGYKVGFVWRMLPDVTFRGSEAASPSIRMTLRPMQNAGSGYNNPESVGGINTALVARTSTYVIEQFTGQINTRVRGRQLVMEVRSSDVGVQWQLGSPRLDIRPDGRR